MAKKLLNNSKREALEGFRNLPDRAQELYWVFKDDAMAYNSWFDECLASINCYCESPIEKIMYLALEIQKSINPKTRDDKNTEVYIEFNPQTKIGNYRVDMNIVAYAYSIGDDEAPVEHIKELIIECDGHEFHEKTKEQVAKNNNRDYELKSMGFDVLHFSGSEIYNDPMECSEKVFGYIFKCLKRMIEEKRNG